MRILYRPVLIESAEQAEALPVGTIAVLPVDRYHRQVLTKTTGRGPGPWERDMHGYGSWLLVGWTALVPIEAEEVRSEPKGVGYATERRAGGPFTAYYVHERTA